MAHVEHRVIRTSDVLSVMKLRNIGRADFEEAALMLLTFELAILERYLTARILALRQFLG